VKVVPWAKSRLTRSFVSISVRQSSSCRRIGKREGGTEGSLPLTSRRKSPRSRLRQSHFLGEEQKSAKVVPRAKSPRSFVSNVIPAIASSRDAKVAPTVRFAFQEVQELGS
jgi:hypothetical protein